MLIDTHAHIQFQGFDADRGAVMKRCQEKGMILNLVGTQKDTSRRAVELAEQYDWMYASIAIHPIHLHASHVDEEESHFVSREEGFDENFFDTLAKSKKVIAVGECGLDLWHIPKDIPKEVVLAKQRQVFLAHIRFAQKHNLPLAIHCREAHDEMIQLLVENHKSKIIHHKSSSQTNPTMVEEVKSLKSEVRGVIHCYTSDWKHAEQYLDLGMYLGFTGVITFPPKKLDSKPQLDLLEVIEKIPLDRMVVETDCPYLAPQAYRGQRSEPWMVEEVIKKIAEVKKLPCDLVEKQIEINTRTLFGL